MRLLSAWCSRTGTTELLAAEAARELEGLGHRVREASIEPRLNLPYPLWLLLSFWPGSKVPLRGGLDSTAGFEACLLSLPKWTFSCPPVNGFLARWGASLPPTAILVTCGGWDQERYLRDLEERAGRLGVPVLGGRTFKRRDVLEGRATGALREFLRDTFPPDP